MLYNKVEICGINTSRLKVMKEAEKMELLKKAHSGENMDDLFQVGVIVLIKAIDNFNTDLDVRFSTYAVPMGRGLRKFYSFIYFSTRF